MRRCESRVLVEGLGFKFENVGLPGLSVVGAFNHDVVILSRHDREEAVRAGDAEGGDCVGDFGQGSGPGDIEVECAEGEGNREKEDDGSDGGVNPLTPRWKISRVLGRPSTEEAMPEAVVGQREAEDDGEEVEETVVACEGDEELERNNGPEADEAGDAG